jgi:hypothetical protein
VKQIREPHLLKDLIMQTLAIERQTPSLFAWSRTARPVPLPTLFGRDPSGEHDTESDEESADLDNVLFGCSTATLLFLPLAVAVAVFVA